jgi:hypothetical protein
MTIHFVQFVVEVQTVRCHADSPKLSLPLRQRGKLTDDDGDGGYQTESGTSCRLPVDGSSLTLTGSSISIALISQGAYECHWTEV